MVSVTASEDLIRDAADRLDAAARTRRPCAPVRDLIGDTDVALAYRVQDTVLRRRVAGGDRPVGRKIGLTSEAVQRQLGVDQPDFGTLLSSMLVDASQAVAPDLLLQPKVEAEIAFVLDRDLLSAEPSLAEVAAAVAGARAALEIVDSRIAGWDICITDTVADNASSGLFVLGDDVVALTDLRLEEVVMELRRDGVPVSAGTGKACLGNPLVALQWLARTAVAVGKPLQAGEVVLSGALGAMVPVTPGETYTATLTGLGAVRVRFAPQTEELSA
jgi:2-keto-4-pentenoate hydratase